MGEIALLELEILGVQGYKMQKVDWFLAIFFAFFSLVPPNLDQK